MGLRARGMKEEERERETDDVLLGLRFGVVLRFFSERGVAIGREIKTGPKQQQPAITAAQQATIHPSLLLRGSSRPVTPLREKDGIRKERQRQGWVWKETLRKLSW